MTKDEATCAERDERDAADQAALAEYRAAEKAAAKVFNAKAQANRDLYLARLAEIEAEGTFETAEEYFRACAR